MRRYTKLALIYSIFFPVFFFFVMLDKLFWNNALTFFFNSGKFLQGIIFFLFIISYIVAPIFLLVGFYLSEGKKISIAKIIPFLINIGLYLLGIFFLFIAIKAILIRPFVILSFHILFYIIGLSVITAVKIFRKD
jgi:hypothetical protein